MQYPSKVKIAKLLNSTFDEATIANYLETSKYRRKKSFIDGILKLSELCRYLSPISSLTARQHVNFREISLLQLEQCISETSNEQLKNYFELIRARFCGKYVQCTGTPLREMINKKEIRILNALSSGDHSREDIVNFLRITMLFGDHKNVYNNETKQNLEKACEMLSA